jgi:hypothetical protein
MLELVARADDQTVTEAVRHAIDIHIEERRRDKDFIERVHRHQVQERALYERLAR